MSTLRDALRRLPDSVFADLLESDEAYLLVIDLPGATDETTDLFVDGGRVRIEARRRKDVPEDYRYLEEDRSLFLDLALPVPPDAVGAEATASLEDGVLEVHLPKRSTASGHRIEID